MEPLSSTLWDVVISGTGIPQSLLALALSRSGRKVLHVDKNDYYGGSDAAFSLDEAREWVGKVKNDSSTGFESATLNEYGTDHQQEDNNAAKVGPSRCYSLSLSPQILYARSRLLPLLVTSGVHEQLEFQAVGSWWLCKDSDDGESDGGNLLQKIPNKREDVFADNTLDVKARRALMKFLRGIMSDDDPEQQSEQQSALQSSDSSLSDFLKDKFKIPSTLYEPLLALSLSPKAASSTPAKDAVSRIKKHMTSIGVFGDGFGAVTAKYGGSSEIAQVGCRAGAVGGGVYVLGCGVEAIQRRPQGDQDNEEEILDVSLSNGENIRARWVAGGTPDLPRARSPPDSDILSKTARSISIVSSGLEQLLPPTSDTGPVPAGAVVMLGKKDGSSANATTSPVYLQIHSQDTGECPSGQLLMLPGIIYASTLSSDTSDFIILDEAVNKLLRATNGSDAHLLWSLHYLQSGRFSSDGNVGISRSPASQRILVFPPPSLDLEFDDGIIDSIREVWRIVMGAESDDEFMMLAPRRRHEDDDE
ncbi:MAG: hypothetical protein Q9227_000001 [Pyrenula ochraceoflavens]